MYNCCNSLIKVSMIKSIRTDDWFFSLFERCNISWLKIRERAHKNGCWYQTMFKINSKIKYVISKDIAEGKRKQYERQAHSMKIKKAIGFQQSAKWIKKNNFFIKTGYIDRKKP